MLKKVACAVGSSPLCSQYTSGGSLPGPFPNNPGSAPDEPKQTVRDFGKNCLQKLLAVRNFLFCNLATLSEMLAHVPEKSGGWNTFGDNVIRTNVFLFCFVFFWHFAARGLWSARAECGMVDYTGLPVCFM